LCQLGSGPRCASASRWSTSSSNVLDDLFIEWLYPTKNGQSPEDRAERVFDYFAACVLMSKMWVKRDWAGGGIQGIARLPRRYRVSQVAMAVQLSGSP
jgi:hypothetical protein